MANFTQSKTGTVTITCLSSGKKARAICMHKVNKKKKEIEFIDLQKYYEKALSSDLDTEKLIALNSDTTFNQIRNKLEITKNQLKEQSRMARLWIQYMDYIDIVKNFRYAERTSNWELHLSSLTKMLNLFAATGHINYAKFGRLYPQNMEIFQKNNNGFTTNS